MSKCTVCGNNVPNFGAKIVRGKSGEWVCKECLNKAGISSVKFSYTFITSDQIESLIKRRKSVENAANNSIKKCAKCGKEYAGIFCPNGCNSPHYKPKKKKVSTIILVLIIWMFAFVATMVILFGEDKTDTSSEESITYIEVTADDLWQAFYDNEVLAEQTYTGQYVKVTGVVGEINSKDFLTSANALLVVEDAMFSCIQCNFNSDNSNQLANLKKGQTVTISGVCGDLELNVHINNCEIE